MEVKTRGNLDLSSLSNSAFAKVYSLLITVQHMYTFKLFRIKTFYLLVFYKQYSLNINGPFVSLSYDMSPLFIPYPLTAYLFSVLLKSHSHSRSNKRNLYIV